MTSRHAFLEASAERRLHRFMKTGTHVHTCAHHVPLFRSHTCRFMGEKKKTTLRVNRTARCKQAERRMEYTGEGSTGEASKKTRVGKGGGLWEEGEEERKQRRGSSILTTCTINNRGSAVVSWEQWGWKGFGVSTCSRRSLPNPNLNRPPTHNKAPLSSPFMHVLCHAPEHIFSHSLIARSLASRPLAAEQRAPACETQGSPWAQ